MKTKQTCKDLAEIKDLLSRGVSVYWKQDNYIVMLDLLGSYVIQCTNNRDCIGLTHLDGTTLNGSIDEFYYYV